MHSFILCVVPLLQFDDTYFSCQVMFSSLIELSVVNIHVHACVIHCFSFDIIQNCLTMVTDLLKMFFKLVGFIVAVV